MSFAAQPHFGIQNCVHLLPCCAHCGDDDTHRGHGFDVVAVEITGCWKHRAKLIVALQQLKETEPVCFTHVTFRCLRWAASIAANGSGCQRLMPRSSISCNSCNAGSPPRILSASASICAEAFACRPPAAVGDDLLHRPGLDRLVRLLARRRVEPHPCAECKPFRHGNK
jgi:hypothetical protein